MKFKLSHFVGAAVFFSLLSLPISVSADLYGVALNANESLALYGSSLSAAYFNGSSVEVAEFSYIGNTFAVRDMYREAGIISSGTSTVQTGGFSFEGDFLSFNIVANTNYLIYRWLPDVSSFPAPSSGGFRLRFEFPIDIECSAFQSSILCSDIFGTIYRNETGGLNNTTNNYYKLFDSDGEELSSHSFTPDSNARYFNTISILPFPIYASENGNAHLFLPSVANNQADLPWFNGIGVRGGAIIDDAPSIIVHSATYQLSRLSPFQYSTDWIYSNGVAAPDTYNDYAVYILIQCPIIYGDYVLPEPEDNTSLGDLNSNLNSLILSTDELRKILLRIESTQNDILTVERVHTSQFINIIDLLNDIYDRMEASGEITIPTLNPASNIPIDSSIDSRVSSELENFEFPNLQDEFNTQEVGGFFDMISGFWSWIPARVIAIYSIAMILGLVTWLLFRGRGA